MGCSVEQAALRAEILLSALVNATEEQGVIQQSTLGKQIEDGIGVLSVGMNVASDVMSMIHVLTELTAGVDALDAKAAIITKERYGIETLRGWVYASNARFAIDDLDPLSNLAVFEMSRYELAQALAWLIVANE